MEEAKQILKEHIEKTVSLNDSQFNYFFSLFKPQSYKKGQTVIAEDGKVDCVKTPVIATSGIANGRGIAAALDWCRRPSNRHSLSWLRRVKHTSGP